MSDKKSFPLDPSDRRILQLLQEDSSRTNKEIALLLKMSPTPVYERIRRLRQEGYIQGYSVRLDRRKLGLGMLAYCEVSLLGHQREYLTTFEDQVRALDEVIECHHITGAFDYLLKIAVGDMDEYQYFIKEKLACLQYISKVESHFVMTEVKEQGVWPI
jgi:DNA-binding Lrp family transcriptional regulator